MAKLYGHTNGYLLFTDDVKAVVIDKTMNMVDEVGHISNLSSIQPWNKTSIDVEQSHVDLAIGALADLKVHAVVASGRMYTIPKAAQAEAKKALEWRKEHKRGGTPVGLNTARTLAAGGQIGIQKVRHIAKYFPRHEVDKKGKGWKPGEDNFPSNGRIAWALWGGDAAWTWSRAIVERENKKALRADGQTFDVDGSTFDDYEVVTRYEADLSAFEEAKTLSTEFAPEFVARVRSDDFGIDRLYKVDFEGYVSVWDSNGWTDLGFVDADIFSYDKALDDEEDQSEKSHIIIDPDTALVLSAHFQQNPFASVSVGDLDEEETRLVEAAMDEIDWTIIDMAVTAAGEAPAGGAATDGQYTPEERAARARKQVRDKTGRFSAMGSRVVVSGDNGVSGRGSITRINPDSQSVTVKLDSGESVDVPALATQSEEDFARNINNTQMENVTPLDTTGILGQPRAPMDRPNAVIPGALPPLTSDSLKTALYNYPAWVQEQRSQQAAAPSTAPAEYKPGDNAKVPPKSDYLKDLEKKAGVKLITDADGKKKKTINYSPITSSGDSEADKKTAGELAATSDPGQEVTPETSDVKPLYIAIVSPDDPRAVFDVVSIVPAGTKSTAPMTFKRANGKWEKDVEILSDLNSPTPPPVVPLNASALEDVLKQVDAAVAASASPIIAEGGADRNRGNAERLRHYWLFGKGALKIRWNTPGDWTRCYKQLMKYMGPRAKGYCSLRHKEATGVWPGSKFNIGKRNKKLIAAGFYDVDLLDEESVLSLIELSARAQAARERVLVAGGTAISDGAKFKIPLIIPEGIESGDGRKFKKGAITVRELPLPLLWQIKTATGHDGSVVVGRIDHMERTDSGIGNAYGCFDTGPYGREAERMVRDGFMRGVSADLDQFEAAEDEVSDEAGADDEKKIGGQKITITQARVMAATIVPKPAFEECKIFIDEESPAAEQPQQEEAKVIPDGVYVEDMDPIEAQSLVACGMIASSIPTVPPATWFTDPKLNGPTPLTVDDNGRVFGHIAAWHVDHIGMSFGTKPPRSKSKYSYFHTGVVRADDGKDYPVGQLTLAGGHASLEASAADAARHYDDTGSAIADVHAGEDAHGIWVAGALRSTASPEQIRALRASAPSGDWRPIKGGLELVAVCQVNVPGFPIARARVASGQVYALVAAGAAVLAKMKADPIADLEARLAKLESAGNAELSVKAAEARNRVQEFVDARNATLAVKAEELAQRIRGDHDYDSFAYISRETRQKLAAEKKALPDGSFPIRNVSDLKNAIHAYGRAGEGKKSAVRRHIIRRARGLGKPELIPEDWKSASALEEDVAYLRAQVASIESRAKEISGETNDSI